MFKAKDLLSFLKQADCEEGMSTIVKNMHQGARAPVDKKVTFKLHPETKPDAFVFSATGGITPLDRSAITKMYKKVRAFRAVRTGSQDQISSHTERISICYWLETVWKVPASAAMEWVSIYNEQVYRKYVAKGLCQHRLSQRLMTGYVMESRIGDSHSQSQLEFFGRWLLDSHTHSKLTWN